MKDSIPFEKLLVDLSSEVVKHLWVVIGPEGGWTEGELAFANKKECINVQFGDTILRTSTAAIAATELMLSWRRNLC